ncbi:hypothetical protein C8R43DRAFT_351423 [Mycena crocata]|nr:hypothetical protein C8R43DRAFT_351423 [Mycena crocata]
MSTNRSPKPMPPSGSSSRAASSRASRPSSTSDWLVNSLVTAKIVVSAAECAPFPFVKGAFGIVVVLLETVEKVKKNRDDLKELCESAVEILTIINEQIVTHGDSAATKFKSRCEEFESVIRKILVTAEQLQAKEKSFRSRVKEVLQVRSNAETIAAYEKRLRHLRANLVLAATIDTNFQVGKALTSKPSIPIPVRRINNCPPASRIFQGRADILNQMQAFFSTNSDNQHIFLLHGLGGAGKTQIALRFIEQSSSSFSNIFMVDGSTTETIEAGFQQIALAKNSGNTMPDALKWLVSTPEEWLLVFDSADDPKMNLNNFFPQCKHGNILITSRNPGLRVYAGSDSLVSDMEETDAVNLLLKSASESDADENKEIATEIVKTLYYLPLAIIQAGAFISKSGALNHYLGVYIKNKAQLLSEKPIQSHDDYRWTVYTTWQLSFNQLSQPAAMLLQLCSFLHHQGIFEEMFSNASSYEFHSHGPTEEELEQPLEFLSQFLDAGGAWDPLKFINITSEISAYSLITFNPQTKYFSIHPLVHEWTRSVLSDEEACHNCMCAILGMGISETPYRDMTLASLRLLPHVDSILLKEDAPEFDFDPEFSKVYYHSRRNEDALNLDAKVFHKRRNIFGNEHPDTLDAMAWLASTYFQLGQFTEAAELEVVVLEKRKKILGDDNPDTLTAMGNLASTYTGLGQFTEAQELDVGVLEKQRKILGDDHPDTLITMGNLASTYHKLGQFTEAEELKVVLLEKQRRILGDDHPDTLITMGNLASTYHKLGQFREAEELKVVVLEKQRRILGDDHIDTLLAMGNLASTYFKLGQFMEAQELEVVVLEKRRKILRDDHPDTLSAMGNLASTHHKLGQLTEAAELEVVVLEKRRKILGDNHPHTLTAMHNHARTYYRLKQFKEAAELQDVVLEKWTQILGPGHPYTLRTRDQLVETYQELGIPTGEAKALIQRIMGTEVSGLH